MRGKGSIVAKFLLAVFLLACFPAAAGAAQWAMHRHDAQHTNSVPYSGPTRISQKWSYQEEVTNGGMAIAQDGTIYFIDGYKILYALNPDGTLKQTYDLYSNGYGISCCTRPVIGPDGTIFISASGIVAFNPDLTVKWYNPNFGNFCCGSMSLGPDGSLYLVEGSVAVLDAQTGTLKWSFDGGDEWATWAPAVSQDGSTVYITTQHMIYVKSSLDGSDLWSYPVENPGTGSAVVAGNGDIYVPNGSSVTVFAKNGLNKKGEPKRSITVGNGNEMVFEIALAADGTMVCVTYDTVQLYSDGYAQIATGGKVYMIDINNVILWSNPIQAQIYPGWTMTYVPLVDANNNVYLATVDSANMAHIYGFDASGSPLFYREFDSNCGGGPVTLAMDAEGVLYASFFMGYTYAYRQTDPWGNYHGDHQHTSSSIYHGPTLASQKWAAGIGTGTATAVALDGTIYVGGSNGNLYAINPDGTIKGVFDGSASGLSNAMICCAPPVIGPDGTIYISGRYTWALNPDLSIKWVDTTSPGLCCGSMTVGPDNTLYKVEWGYLDAYDGQTGVIKWSLTTPLGIGNEASHSPAISANGKTLYLPTQANIYAINSADGAILWDYPITNPGWATALVGPDGKIYVSNDMSVTILNVDGSFSQSINVGASVFEIALGADGTIACVTYDSWAPVSAYYSDIAGQASGASLHAIDPVTETVKWSAAIMGAPTYAYLTAFSPVIDAAGNIYIFSRDTAGNYLYGFDALGSQLFMEQVPIGAQHYLDGLAANVTIAADGTLYVSWYYGDLYAFEQTL